VVGRSGQELATAVVGRWMFGAAVVGGVRQIFVERGKDIGAVAQVGTQQIVFVGVTAKSGGGRRRLQLYFVPAQVGQTTRGG
jgi:hypothetical protein